MCLNAFLVSSVIMAALRIADADIIFLPCGFNLLLFFSSPNLSGRRVDVYHTSTHGVAANLECRSEMCCTRLAGNTGRKNDANNRHLRTIAQLYRAESSQLRHLSTIRKLVKQQCLLHIHVCTIW